MLAAQELINGEKVFTAYESRYYLPSHESGSTNPLYYSFDVRRLWCMHGTQLLLSIK